MRRLRGATNLWVEMAPFIHQINKSKSHHTSRVGQDHVYTVYINIFGRETTKYIYSRVRCIYTRFWPTLRILHHR